MHGVTAHARHISLCMLPVTRRGHVSLCMSTMCIFSMCATCQSPEAAMRLDRRLPHVYMSTWKYEVSPCMPHCPYAARCLSICKHKAPLHMIIKCQAGRDSPYLPKMMSGKLQRVCLECCLNTYFVQKGSSLLPPMKCKIDDGVDGCYQNWTKSIHKWIFNYKI